MIEEQRVKKLLNAGVSSHDIIHGYLKELMAETEELMKEFSSETQQHYLEGRLDAFVLLYQATYTISFAEGER